MIGIYIYRKLWLRFIETNLFRVNFPELYEEYHHSKGEKTKVLRGVNPKAKEQLKKLIKGYKKIKSHLRPNNQD